MISILFLVLFTILICGPFDDPAQRGHWEEVGARHIWDRYFEVWCQAVTSSAPFTVMAHPDLVKKFNIYPEGDWKKYYAQAAEAAMRAIV